MKRHLLLVILGVFSLATSGCSFMSPQPDRTQYFILSPAGKQFRRLHLAGLNRAAFDRFGSNQVPRLSQAAVGGYARRFQPPDGFRSKAMG
jgi:hypothetical protein